MRFWAWVMVILCALWGAEALAVPQEESMNAEAANGAYYAAGFDGTDFWVAGSDGRVARIDAEGSIEIYPTPVTVDLHDLWIGTDRMMVCGDHGALLYRTDDSEGLILVDTGTDQNLYAITFFRGAYYVAGAGGTLLTSTDGCAWRTVNMNTSNAIIGLEANETLMMAITAESDYWITANGTRWKQQNYNAYYDGYARLCTFTALKNMGETFFVIGQTLENPDMPLILYTMTGSVWYEKVLSRINDGTIWAAMPMTLYAIDCQLDQMLVACNRGRLLTVTNCAECNELGEYAAEDLYALAFGDEKLLVAGANFSYRCIDRHQVRQYDIKAAQAREDHERGAAIIDVRERSEWEEGHIAGAIHIPLGEIESQLRERIPDASTELIFYCGSGRRAQTALEMALTMGYVQVYNLGSWSNWPYELEP